MPTLIPTTNEIDVTIADTSVTSGPVVKFGEGKFKATFGRFRFGENTELHRGSDRTVELYREHSGTTTSYTEA